MRHRQARTPSLLSGDDFTARVRARDHEAMSAVVEAYLHQILRTARGAGLSPHDAEEVTQETFKTFIEVAPRFEGRSHVRTWLFGILYRKISEARRGLAKDRQNDEIDDLVEARFDRNGSWVRPPTAADSRALAREVRGQISGCLEAAPMRQRMAFVLREVEGLSTSEICAALRITTTNLGALLSRVRNRMRECLEVKGLKRERRAHL